MNERLNLWGLDEEDFFYREAIKKLRANIQFSGKRNKIIMITSVFSGEGKSEVSLHLAKEMANAGKKVLYIDADIRKSVFVERYEIEGEHHGLSDHLSGQIENDDLIVFPTNTEGLDVILAGHYAPNPAEMLGDEQFVRIVKKHGADRILFATDSPWSDQKATLDRVRALGFEGAELEAILGGNAKRVFSVPERNTDI